MDVTMEIGKNIVRGTFIDVLHVLKIVKTLFFLSRLLHTATRLNSTTIHAH